MREGLIILAAVAVSIGGFAWASLGLATLVGRWMAWCEANRQ
jgi:hypothetical protein